jgi:hypothetical protein
MDAGLPNPGCGGDFQVCGPGESFTGLWEVPVADLTYNGQVYTMDPGDGGGKGDGGKKAAAGASSAYDIMKYNFDAAYGGNRAPLPFFVHVAWFTPARIADMQRFVAYALAKRDTYFVTISQLLEWTAAPVPVDQMPAWLARRCGGADNRPPPQPPAPAPASGPEPAPGEQGTLSWLAAAGAFRPAIFGRRLRWLLPR